ncbi:hypothetical protein KR038_006932 [Drosophila bunnanda]|nr:hypothetical protein KR038_006932 [Drosophila bunnanda]
MGLSRKEIIAVLLLVSAVINVINASYFANLVQLYASYEQVAHQVVCVGSAYIGLIYGLSTWMYHSNYYRSRQEMRYVLATMLVIIISCNCVSTYFLRKKMSYANLAVCTDLRLLFTNIANVGRTVSVILSVVCILLLFVALTLILHKICKARKGQPKAEPV